MKTILKLTLGLVLLIASQACAPRAGITPDPNAIGSAIAGTSAAAQTQTALVSIPNTGQGSPTATKIATWTPFPTFTSAVVAPRITVSVDTNCRAGPGRAYDRIATLMAGEVVDVVGRSANGNYWIIRNPDGPGVCWIAAANVTMAGIPGILPVFTPPPTPTPTRTRTPLPPPTRTFTPVPSPTLSPTLAPTLAPGFALSHSSSAESCSPTEWWVEVLLQNVGGTTFQSIGITVVDTATTTGGSLILEDFINRNGCTDVDARPDLPTGANHLVSSPVLPEDPTGHLVHISVTLCSEPGQSGICILRELDFTPQ